jgi:hypothetical protein
MDAGGAGMNRPSYKELWSDEYKDRDEQLQWIRNAVNGNAKFCNSEPPYSEEEELARKIMQMHARIAELEAAQRWIPVSERLPECEKDVLVFWGKALDGSKIDWFGTAWRNDSDDGKWCTDPIVPTHWMPLPELPIVYGKERER